MKYLVMLISLTGSYLNCFAQKIMEVKVRVTDAETKTGITDANVLIQETMMTAKTAQFGLAVFPNVPVRQVTIEVQKDGYLPKKEEINITEDPFNNTFALELIKEKNNTVTIYGVVKAGSKRLPDVAVTLTIGSYQEKVITTKNGDYSFQVPKEKVTTKVKLLFAHSRYAGQEREFEVLQSQSVKEVDAVVLSGAVEDVQMRPEECWYAANQLYLGIACFDNQLGLDVEIYYLNAFDGRFIKIPGVFVATGKTNCTMRIAVNYFDKESIVTDVLCHLRTIPKNSMEQPMYAVITVPVEKCWKQVHVLNKDNVHFSKDQPR